MWYHQKAPCKFVLLGEYAILFPKGEGLVMSVSPFVCSHLYRQDKNINYNLKNNKENSSKNNKFKVVLPNFSYDIKDFGEKSNEECIVKEESEYCKNSVYKFLLGIYRFLQTHTNSELYEAIIISHLSFDSSTCEFHNSNIFNKTYSSLEDLESQIRMFLEKSSFIEKYPFYKHGVGTSASSIVANLNIINRAFELNISNDALLEKAYKIHSNVQSNYDSENIGSGIDILASSKSGVTHAINSNFPEKQSDHKFPLKYSNITWPLNWSPIFVSTKKAISTPERIKEVFKFYKNNHLSITQWVDDSNKIVRKSLSAIYENDYISFLESIHQNRILLNELGNMCNFDMEGGEIRSIISKTKKIAVGKQSGAGGGDSLLLFPKKDVDKSDLIDCLNENKFKITNSSLYQEM